MNKNVYWSYVTRDTSPIIGQRKWLCHKCLWLNSAFFNNIFQKRICFPEKHMMELFSEKAQSLTLEKGLKYASVFFLYRTTNFRKQRFFSSWGYCRNQNFLFKLVILDINSWRFHHSIRILTAAKTFNIINLLNAKLSRAHKRKGILSKFKDLHILWENPSHVSIFGWNGNGRGLM